MTPNDLDVLLHCYVSPSPHPRIEAPAVKQSLDMWQDAGCLTYNSAEACYQCTERGNLHVKQLLNIPLPALQELWVDYKGDVL